MKEQKKIEIGEKERNSLRGKLDSHTISSSYVDIINYLKKGQVMGFRRLIKSIKAYYNNQDTIKNPQQEDIDRFHNIYYNNRKTTWGNTFWFGIKTLKCPLDLWIYQEILFEIKPDLIIETGTSHGGSAYFLACMCDLIGNGRILTIDIEQINNRPIHDRIEYYHGSSTSDDTIQHVISRLKEEQKIMVILDSDHSKSHVLEELKIYSDFVSKGSYLIVEDTNVGGHPVAPDFGEGPTEAIEEFLADNKNFSIDRSKEKFFLTFNPNGFLKRIES